MQPGRNSNHSFQRLMQPRWVIAYWFKKVSCPPGRSISTSNVTLPTVVNTVDLTSSSRLQEYSVIDIFNRDEAGMRHGVTAKMTLAIKVKPVRREIWRRRKKRHVGDRKVLSSKLHKTVSHFSKWLLHWVKKVIKEGCRIDLLLDNRTINKISLSYLSLCITNEP